MDVTTHRNIKEPRKLFGRSSEQGSDCNLCRHYDAIVVGAGPSGASAAYFMAKEGLKVLLLERGPYPASKNCGGASIAAEPVHALFPNFWEEFEYERIVTDQRYWFMTEDSVVSVGIANLKLAARPI